MTTNAKIILEQGGSVLRVASGGSITIESGGKFNLSGELAASGTLTIVGASMVVNDQASMTIKPGASAGDQPYSIMNMGNNQMWYAAGSSGSPTFLASPGDLAWVANSASTSLWANVSDGTAGSNWRAFRLETGSQIVTGP